MRNTVEGNELERIVQRMIDAGEPEDNIASVIREFGAAEPMAVTPGPAPSPGNISLGGAALSAAPALRSGVSAAAGLVARHPRLVTRVAGTALGMGTGGPLGGEVGYLLSKGLEKGVGDAAKAVQAATSTAMPRAAGRFAALPAGRAVVNTISKAAPWLGTGMIIADAALNWRKYQEAKKAFTEEANAAEAKYGR